MSGCEKQAYVDGTHLVTDEAPLCGYSDGTAICGAQLLAGRVIRGACLVEAPETQQVVEGYPDAEATEA